MTLAKSTYKQGLMNAQADQLLEAILKTDMTVLRHRSEVAETRPPPDYF